MSKWDNGKYKQLMDLIVSKCKGKVLDIGCGRGEFVKVYKNSKGIDLQERPEWSGLNCCVDDVLLTDFNGFDCLLFNNSFEHFEDKDLVVQKIFDCDKEFRVVIVVPRLRHLVKGWFRFFFNVLLKLFGRKHEDLRYLLVHSWNVYGFNFLSAFFDFLFWDKMFFQYFRGFEKFVFWDYCVYVCRVNKRGRGWF